MKTPEYQDFKLPWPIAGERLVAFIDMMGFKNMVANWTDEEIYDLMATVFKGVGDATTFVRGTTTFEENGVRYKVDEPLAKVAFFSDSILIVSAGCGAGCAMAVIMGAMKSYIALANAGVPCRGGVAKGNCVADFERSIFFGQALIDAYLLGESLQFYGIAMEVGTFVQNQEEELEERTDEWIPMTQHCKVALKGEIEKEVEVINWPAFADSEASIVSVLAPFENPESPKLNFYYKNTLEQAVRAYRETYPKPVKRG